MRTTLLALLTLCTLSFGFVACQSTGDDDASPTPSATPTDTPSPSPTATATPIASCDVGDCQTCLDSTCSATACATELATCTNDAECGALIACFDGCAGDQTCVGNCMSSYPNGTQLYLALVSCMVCEPDACSIDCADIGASLCQ